MLSAAEQSAGAEVLQCLERHGYRLWPEPLRTGRPDRLTLALVSRTGLPVIAKLYPAELGERTFGNMEKLWRSSFGGQRKPPGLAQPLDFLPEIGALLMERLQGRPLIELGPITRNDLERSIQLLSELHRSGVQPDLKRSWRGILRSARRKVHRIGELAPQYIEHVKPVVEALESGAVEDSELVCAHGDFSPRNVLADPQRWILIDWDRLQLADPARDVAYFAIWPWRDALRRGRWPDRSVLKQVAKAYETVRSDARIRDHLPFHAAAGLLRMACSLVELWPQQSYLVPALAKAALRELESQ